MASEGTLKEITSIEELDRILTQSTSQPVMIFKHSLTCPISTRAMRELELFLDNAAERLSCNLITVQISRPVSDEVAQRLRVTHETPQAILLRDGKPVWNASHLEITIDSLTKALRTCI